MEKRALFDEPLRCGPQLVRFVLCVCDALNGNRELCRAPDPRASFLLMADLHLYAACMWFVVPLYGFWTCSTRMHSNIQIRPSQFHSFTH